MTGVSPDDIQESEALARVLVTNVALRRLAENPLLLTMLLVVKHGAGRLPPDRVSLYSRAVEVLLDTWNIKGHDALNMKEAIPQLSYIAFELMRSGKQTATERELLEILENARDNVPQIKRYARDTPYEFLKRVELRSSLLLEAGHQVEGGRAVPFYQFRHLTFQEYLAALAIVEGNYDGYDQKFPMKPITSYLTADEWKEVVPMSAVLAGKQAESILKVLVQRGNVLKKKMDAGQNFRGKKEWLAHPNTLPSVISRLVQSLIEEAHAEQRTLGEALKLVVYFARGCQSAMDWQTLCRGPYAGELLSQAWRLYEPMDYPIDTWLRNSYASFAAYRKSVRHWGSTDGQMELLDLLLSEDDEQKCLGLMTCVGVLWNKRGPDNKHAGVTTPELEIEIERLLYDPNPAVSHVALWNWGLNRHSSSQVPFPKVEILNYLLSGLLKSDGSDASNLYAFCLDTCYEGIRGYWDPALNGDQIETIRNLYEMGEYGIRNKHKLAALLVAFYSGAVYEDEKLCEELVEARKFFVEWRKDRVNFIDDLIAQIPLYGAVCLKNLAENDSEVKEEEYLDFDELYNSDEMEDVSL